MPNQTTFRCLSLLSVAAVCCLWSNSQNSHIVIDKNLVYRLDNTPERIDNHNYNSFYAVGKDVYNLKSIPISHSSSDIIDFKVNPAGYSYAVLSGKGKKYVLTIYDTNIPKRTINKLEQLNLPSAMVYSADSRYLFVADDNQIKKLDSKTLHEEKSFPISGKPSKLICDENGLYLGCVNDNILEVYNEQTGMLRTTLPHPVKIADTSFTRTGDKLMILGTDGSLDTYNVRDFSHDKHFSDIGPAFSLSIHPDDKYVAVTTEGNKVQFLNLLDDFDRPYITDSNGPIRYSRFVTNRNGDVFITFDAPKSIVYKRMAGFTPNYTKIAREQLDEMMREWTKMRPMESEEEYRSRVNPESIEKQRRLFANEIATSLAGDLISHGIVTLGSYNPHTGLLTVNISSLPPIYLQVPQEDTSTFGDGTNLAFSNAVYGITPADTFELIYVDVFNPTNNKTYSFNNLDREDLSFIHSDDSFVSLDLIMKSNREDVLLKSIKDRIVEEARAKNLISEHTVINVDTRIDPTFDANGKNINNYRVAFNYTVDPGYSEKEDFPSGKYFIETSNAASSMMRIIKQAFESEFADYLGEGKKLVIEITGSADGAPINHGIPYSGGLGTFDNEPVRINGELSSLSVSPQTGIRKNEQLAFMRAQALRHAMSEHLPQIDRMDTDYRYNIEVSKERGGEYRRINVAFTFVDAL